MTTPKKEKVIAVFDFDDTITLKDTLFDFIKFCFSPIRFYLGILSVLPILVAFKLKTVSAEAAKQELLYHFFAGKEYRFFAGKCDLYKERINEILRPEASAKIKWHQNQGHKVIIISASVTDWIKPWAQSAEIDDVYGTGLEVTDGIISGRLATKNCKGEEKVKRLLEAYPDRESYTLYVYGDSDGDKDLLEIADYPFYRNF